MNYRLSNTTADIHYSKAGRKCMRSNLQRDQSHYGLMLLWQLEAKQTCALTTLLTQIKWTLIPSDLSSTIKPWWGHREKKKGEYQSNISVSLCSDQLRGMIGVSTATWQSCCLITNGHICYPSVPIGLRWVAFPLSGHCSELAKFCLQVCRLLLI